MADQKTPQQLAEGMIPGGAFVNWLSQFGGSNNSRPNPQVQAAQAEQMRRARIGYGINTRRLAARLPPLTDHHLDAAIDAELNAYATQANQNRNALRMQTQPTQPAP